VHEVRRWLAPLAVGALVAAVAWQAALVATPYALMRVAMRRLGATGQTNAFAHAPPTRAERQPVVRPSPDLLYSICVFDVSRGAVLVDVPPIAGHYWSVSVFDARTDVAAVRSDRDTGGGPVRLALVSDDAAAAPSGYEAVRLDHAHGIALIRVLVSGDADYRVVDPVRKQASCRADQAEG
jgi:uncharacterized membrane protein